MNLNKHIFSLSKRLCNANFYALALIYFFNFHCELVYGLQNENSLTDNDVIEYEFENKIYASTIKSVEIRRGLEIPSYPTLLLNSGEFFTIEFDDLNEEEVDYYFTLKHCDRNWNMKTLQRPLFSQPD